MTETFLGLGSNLGDGKANLDRALQLIGQTIGRVTATSSYIESEPWGFESEHTFTNAVCAVETSLNPMELLDATQHIERLMGRTHKHRAGENYSDRIIDIDILLYGDLHIDSERLTIPHPLIEKRDFVRLPLAECIEKLKASDNSKYLNTENTEQSN